MKDLPDSSTITKENMIHVMNDMYGSKKEKTADDYINMTRSEQFLERRFPIQDNNLILLNPCTLSRQNTQQINMMNPPNEKTNENDLGHSMSAPVNLADKVKQVEKDEVFIKFEDMVEDILDSQENTPNFALSN